MDTKDMYNVCKLLMLTKEEYVKLNFNRIPVIDLCSEQPLNDMHSCYGGCYTDSF